MGRLCDYGELRWVDYVRELRGHIMWVRCVDYVGELRREDYVGTGI